MTTSDKKKTIIEIVPTFLLRSVDPAKVVKDYKQGYYQSLVFHSKSEKRKSLQHQAISLTPEYDKNPESEVYAYIDKSNVQKVVGTTNHRSYEFIKAHSNGETLPYGHGEKCLWCRVELKSPPIGLPIKLNILQNGKGKKYQFHCEGTYCSFECCYAGFVHYNLPLYHFRDPLHMETEQLLRFMYSLIYDDAILRQAPDWRILKDNGGFLSYEDFTKFNHGYQRLPSIILLPVKVEYAQKD